MSSTMHLPIIHILHKIYRRYTYVDIIQRRTTAIYEKFQNIDRPIQFKIEHLDNTGALSLLDFKMQMKISPRFQREVSQTYE